MYLSAICFFIWELEDVTGKMEDVLVKILRIRISHHRVIARYEAISLGQASCASLLHKSGSA
jgi:hypothetical protein